MDLDYTNRAGTAQTAPPTAQEVLAPMQDQPSGDHRRMIKTRTPGIYKRGGRYAFVYYDSQGKQRKGSARTLDEARVKKAKAEADMARGEFHETSRLTLRAYSEEWLGRYQGRGRRGFRESTRDEYGRLFRNFIWPYFDDRIRLRDLRTRHIANLVGWLCDEEEHDRRFSDSTVGNILDPLRSCLATALQEGLIRQNPCQGVSLPHRPEPEDDDRDERRALTRAELAAFLTVAPLRFRLFFELLASTGLRISEAIALQRRHLHLDGSRPHIRVRRARVKGRIVAPKTRFGKRQVPLSPTLVSRLRAQLATLDADDPETIVFPSTVGTLLDSDNLRRRVLVPIAQEINAPWIGFHSFRHTCASLLFERGRNVVQVQRWLGHHAPSFTLDTYVHLLSDELGDALELHEELFDLAASGVATKVATDPTPTQHNPAHDNDADARVWRDFTGQPTLGTSAA